MPALLSPTPTSQIVIEQITQAATPTSVGTSVLTFDHPVTSQNQVLIVSAGADQTTISNITYNGVPLVKQVNAVTGSNENAEIWMMVNPPVGTYPVVVTIGASAWVAASAITLSGIDTQQLSPVVATATGTSAAAVLSITPSSANSIILASYYAQADGHIGGANTINAVQFWNKQGQSFENVGGLFGFSAPSLQGTIQFTLSSGQRWAFVAIALEPVHAPSIWFPNIGPRNIADTNVQDTNYQNATSQLGYHQASFFQNSFLHTVGRISAVAYPPAYGILSSANTQSNIVIDRITENSSPSGFTNIEHTIYSPNSVLVVITSDSNGSGAVSFNGNPLTLLKGVTSTGKGGSIFLNVFYLASPPVGTYQITTVNINQYYVALTLLGVDKTNNPIVFSKNDNSGSISNATLPVYPASANSFILDAVQAEKNMGAGGHINGLVPNQNQNLILSSGALNISYAIVNPGEQTLSWGIPYVSPVWGYIAVIFEPSKSISIWNPSVRERSLQDIINANSLNTSDFSGGLLGSFGDLPVQFWHNSFLHTIGRIGQANVPIGTIVSETEQETSQIIIDKVFQGQVASQIASTVNLNMDVSIPSPDAILVVTGGSVIATGANWTSVQFNGNSLTNLVQASVAGADAEIWYMPYPPVGIGQLTISSGTGGEIYANAMVILGVDKRSTNIQVASATDAASTSTIGALITPDAPNSLVIDTLSTLNATTFPVQDSSQTQVFNASALAGNEYVLSTYKIASGAQNMNYNLSVAVNAALVAVSFRPAQAASMWFPNINMRQLDDVITVAGLDAEVNPAFGQYGYKASAFYLNSFLHTIGRQNRNFPVSNIFNATLLLLGVG